MLNSTEHKIYMLINVEVLVNVKMPTTVGILTIISMMNKTSESLKARTVFIFQHFSFYEKLKFHTQFITSGPGFLSMSFESCAVYEHSGSVVECLT